MTEPRVSVIVTAYNEGEHIVPALDRILEAVKLPCEVRVVFDSPDDTTAPHVKKYAQGDSRVVPTLNTYGAGPANAIRFGIDHASAPVVVVTMADGCDDPMQIDELARLVERGVVVAAASRYMRGGQRLPREARAETEHVPTQILRDPSRELEVGDAEAPVEPDRRDLRDGLTKPARLRDKFCLLYTSPSPRD